MATATTIERILAARPGSYVGAGWYVRRASVLRPVRCAHCRHPIAVGTTHLGSTRVTETASRRDWYRTVRYTTRVNVHVTPCDTPGCGWPDGCAVHIVASLDGRLQLPRAGGIIDNYEGNEPCRLCGGPTRGTRVKRYRVAADPAPVPWEGPARPDSLVRHEPATCWHQSTIAVDAATFDMMLPPGMSPTSTAAWLHLYRLSAVPRRADPPETLAELKRLRAEIEDLIEGGFGTWYGPFGRGGSAAMLGDALARYSELTRSLYSRWEHVARDIAAWYRREGRALGPIIARRDAEHRRLQSERDRRDRVAQTS